MQSSESNGEPHTLLTYLFLKDVDWTLSVMSMCILEGYLDPPRAACISLDELLDNRLSINKQGYKVTRTQVT